MSLTGGLGRSSNFPRRKSLLRRGFLFGLTTQPAIAHGDQFQAQGVQFDKACGILLVVGAGVVFEGDMRLGIQRMIGPARDRAGEAFVELV